MKGCPGQATFFLIKEIDFGILQLVIPTRKDKCKFLLLKYLPITPLDYSYVKGMLA